MVFGRLITFLVGFGNFSGAMSNFGRVCFSLGDISSELIQGKKLLWITVDYQQIPTRNWSDRGLIVGFYM